MLVAFVMPSSSVLGCFVSGGEGQMARKTTEPVTLSLRIREELRKRVEREAKRADRSMNAEIIQGLSNRSSRGTSSKLSRKRPAT